MRPRDKFYVKSFVVYIHKAALKHGPINQGLLLDFATFIKDTTKNIENT